MHGYPRPEGSTHTTHSGASETVFPQLGINSTQGWNLLSPWLPSLHSASSRRVQVDCVVLRMVRAPPVHPWWPLRNDEDELVSKLRTLFLLRRCLRDHNTIQTRAFCEDDPLLLYTPSASTSCAGGCLGSAPLRIALQPRCRAAPG